MEVKKSDDNALLVEPLEKTHRTCSIPERQDTESTKNRRRLGSCYVFREALEMIKDKTMFWGHEAAKGSQKPWTAN